MIGNGRKAFKFYNKLDETLGHWPVSASESAFLVDTSSPTNGTTTAQGWFYSISLFILTVQCNILQETSLFERFFAEKCYSNFHLFLWREFCGPITSRTTLIPQPWIYHGKSPDPEGAVTVV